MCLNGHTRRGHLGLEKVSKGGQREREQEAPSAGERGSSLFPIMERTARPQQTATSDQQGRPATRTCLLHLPVLSTHMSTQRQGSQVTPLCAHSSLEALRGCILATALSFEVNITKHLLMKLTSE